MRIWELKNCRTYPESVFVFPCDDFFSVSDAFMCGLEMLYSLIFLYKEVVVFTAQNASIKHPLI